MNTPAEDAPIDFEPLIPLLHKAKWITGLNITKPDDIRLTLTPKGRAGMAALAKWTDTLLRRQRSWLRTLRFYFGAPIVCAKFGLWPMPLEHLHKLIAVARVEVAGGNPPPPAPTIAPDLRRF